MLRKVVIILAACAAANASMAAPPPDEIRYTFLDVVGTFGEVELFGQDIDVRSASASGSLGVTNNLALFAAVGRAELLLSDLNPLLPDIDTTLLTLGVNPHFEIYDNVDIIIPVALKRTEQSDGVFANDGTGYSVGLGVRALLTPAIELGLGVEYVDIEGDDQFASGSLRWHITELVSVAAGITIDSDSRETALNARFTF